MSEVDRDAAGAAAPATRVRTASRWRWAVVVACLVGLPIGWLLCYAALLPFFLGLFFFVLFGLLLGAVLFRIGQVSRPLPRITLLAGSAAVIVVSWTTAFLTETYDFPRQVATYSYEKIRKLPEGMTPAQFREKAAADVAAHLRREFPPSGPIGYARWAITSSRIDPPTAMLQKPFRSSQFRWWWVIRVGLSVALLTAGVLSQVLPLGHLPDARERKGTAVNPLSKI